MSSEFPMTFASEVASDPKNKKKRSNVIPLSQPQNSMIASAHTSSGRFSKMQNDYNMSQFDDGARFESSRKTSPARMVLRGFLLTVLAAVLFAVGTGRLTSDSPEVEKVRSLLSLSQSVERTAENNEFASGHVAQAVDAVQFENQNQPSAVPAKDELATTSSTPVVTPMLEPKMAIEPLEKELREIELLNAQIAEKLKEVRSKLRQ